MLRRIVKILTLLSFALFIPWVGNAQIKQPVKWDISAVQVNDQEAHIVFTAMIDEGWHIYSQYLEDGGPVPTKFTFDNSDDFTLTDKVEENSEPVEKFDPTFLMQVVWFEKSAVFTQRIKMNRPSAVVKGKILFMACSEYECLVPQEKEFSVEVKMRKPEIENRHGATRKDKNEGKSANDQNSIRHSQESVTDTSLLAASVSSEPRTTPGTRELEDLPAQADPQVSGWSIFVLGFLGGFVALLMPCIFPMIPFTVSYFLRASGSQRSQIKMATLYGISIIVIYVGLGLLITLLFGADALNSFSTSGVFNLGIFILLVLFAASLLGGFEITLPSSWINKADAQSDRKGFAGIFFMAATLALVSFSCTAPLVGSLLVTSVKMGTFLPPVVGMLGFSLALALPFTLFAMFPSWLKRLPKSGGWLNSVKVVLGFLELALALKFLSNVDLAYHWQWFDREVFLVLWIIIFGLTGFYLLGKIKLPHDTELKFISPARLFLAVVSLAFTLYMIPGLWGAPLKVIAAFLPPQQTQDFDLYSASLIPASFANEKGNIQADGDAKKYTDLFRAPHGLNAFFDFDEGIAYARKVNKPVLIDFTGHACVNCRKMETTIWSDPEVMKRLREDYVLVQLYVDDKTTLPETEQKISSFSGKKISTLGSKWSDLQASVFNTNAQPYYVLLDGQGDQLVPPSGADYNVENFKRFLSEGITAFNEHREYN